MVTRRTSVIPASVVAFVIGTLGFLLVVGPYALIPTNIAWLPDGDSTTHFLGWHFFRSTDWSFPIGLNPSYGLELSGSILFSDSIPLLAFLFKPFSSLLPHTFQYIGIWVLLCFILQAWLAYKLIGLFSENPVIRILGAGLFVFSPPMQYRLFAQFSLAGHFCILAALYLSLRPTQEKHAILWTALLAVSAMIHAYLLAMVLAFWITDLAQALFRRQRTASAIGIEFVVITAITGIVCWQTGYFTVEKGLAAGGYGYFRTNLLSIFNARGWSYILPDTPKNVNEESGSHFLGLGVIFLLFCMLPILSTGWHNLRSAVRGRTALIILLAGFTAFSLTNKIGIGSMEFEFPLPESIIHYANVFRASERIFWPVFYSIVLAIIFVVVRSNSSRTAITLLAVALTIQILDTSAGWQIIRARMMVTPNTEKPIPLVDDLWTQAASRYQAVRWIPPRNFSPHWQTLSIYAGRHGLATDAAYLARADWNKTINARRSAQAMVDAGTYAADSMYFIDPTYLEAVKSGINADTDLLASVDGFNVLLPGWKNCEDCAQLTKDREVANTLPTAKE